MNEAEILEQVAQDERFRRYVSGLPAKSWRRVLHESSLTPWFVFNPKFGWYEGTGCDAADAMVYGYPKRLGRPVNESDEEAKALGLSLVEGAKVTRLRF